MSIPTSSGAIPPDDNQSLPVVPEKKPQSFFRKYRSLLLRLGCTLVLLAFLLRSVSWVDLLRQAAHLDPGMLLIGIALGFYGIVVSSYQWQSLLDAEHIVLDLRRLVNLYTIGIAFNHFLPTGMGGDVVKTYYVAKEGRNMAGSASAVLMSRMTGFFAMILASLPAFLFWHMLIARQIKIGYILACMAMLTVLGLAYLLVEFLPRFSRLRWLPSCLIPSLLQLGQALRASFRRPRTLGIATLFGLLYHIGYIVNFYIYGLLLHISVPLPFYMIAIPLVSIIAFFPFSINGFGVREGAFVLLFSTVHVPVPTAMLLILLMDAQVLLFGMVGGVLYLTSGLKHEQMEISLGTGV
ncbi:lysylphosphatidylglycerol synthase transmembrane domain-containing protein [Dictyobacter arantiisoli]|uniref:Dolichol-P-glucose synthetase n=1 Tax=Dictyobacter arantiisoli TaxID=2014874 RepID=A0A5A5TDS8_9CHLR|nr:lysylphosphatidylglycerol synthase transmembrane domain-containing protein [Dictyobacter arantiisoli]GCF09701.1 hypothetical protein KDI_32650 [Dictyobacter arantiisoli]